MWQIYLIFTLSTCFLFSNTAEINPCDVLEEGQLWAPNPRGCAMYFYCSGDGTAKPGKCDAGYHFNFPTQSCELPDTVGCTIDDELWITQCPGNGISKIPHPYSCSQYSVCLDDKPQDRSCPEGLNFSPYDQECVDPSHVSCQTDKLTCQNAEPFVPLFIPSSRDCTTYYICFNNRLITLSCGSGQEFDRVRNQCVPAGESGCDVDVLNPDVVIPDQLTYDCSGEVNGSRIPHPESCSFWFWCLNGHSQIFWCGREALFDMESRTCTRDTLARCYTANGNTELQLTQKQQKRMQLTDKSGTEA